jgi:cullin 4
VAVQGKEALAGISREELYRAVEDLCVHKMGARLYDRLKAECARHIAQAVGGLVAQQHQGLDQALFLARVDDVWQDHCEHMLTIRSIFLYLDRSHVLQTPGLQPIWEMGLALFRQQLAQQGQQDTGLGGGGGGVGGSGGLGVSVGVGVEARVIRGLLDLVERQRNGESVNVSLLRSLVRMLTSLGLYKPTFLRAFLEDTGRYFLAEGERRVETLDVVGFLRHVEGRLLEAQEAVVQYLEPGTRRPLVQTIEAQLLAPHVSAVIEKGFEPLMDANRCVLDECLRVGGGACVCLRADDVHHTVDGGMAWILV